MPLLIWFSVYHLLADANSRRTKSSTVLISVSTSFGTLFPSLQNRPSCDRVSLVVSPWYNRNGWLGVKHQVTYVPLVTSTEILVPSLPDFLESSQTIQRWDSLTNTTNYTTSVGIYIYMDKTRQTVQTRQTKRKTTTTKENKKEQRESLFSPVPLVCRFESATGSTFSSKLVFRGHFLVTLPLRTNETLKQLKPLPIFMQNHYGWWQCSVRYSFPCHPPPPNPRPPKNSTPHLQGSRSPPSTSPEET